MFDHMSRGRGNMGRVISIFEHTLPSLRALEEVLNLFAYVCYYMADAKNNTYT